MKTSFTNRQRAALVVPPVLLLSMYGVFRLLVAWVGFPLGYLLAFAVYWTVWCGLVPVALVGRRRLARLFSRRTARRPDRLSRALLLWPIAVPLCFSFVPRLPVVSVVVLLTSALLGVTTGLAEESLWRGVYVTLFRDRVSLARTYPSVAFGLWHVCPLSVAPSHYPGGAITFVVYSTLLGLSYAVAARQSRSLFWCAISHGVHDTLGLGGLMYVLSR